MTKKILLNKMFRKDDEFVCIYNFFLIMQYLREIVEVNTNYISH